MTIFGISGLGNGVEWLLLSFGLFCTWSRRRGQECHLAKQKGCFFSCLPSLLSPYNSCFCPSVGSATGCLKNAICFSLR